MGNVAEYVVDRLSKLGITDCFGCKDWFAARAATNGELDKAMERAQKHKGACYIEIIAGRMDFTLGLKVMNSRLMQMYGFNDEREMP